LEETLIGLGLRPGLFLDRIFKATDNIWRANAFKYSDCTWLYRHDLLRDQVAIYNLSLGIKRRSESV